MIRKLDLQEYGVSRRQVRANSGQRCRIVLINCIVCGLAPRPLAHESLSATNTRTGRPWRAPAVVLGGVSLAGVIPTTVRPACFAAIALMT